MYKLRCLLKFCLSYILLCFIHVTTVAEGIDIGLFNTGCGEFEIRLRPSTGFDSNITNIQFTLKWPENTVGLINVASDYQLTQQGPVFNHNGHDYAVFVSVALGGGLPVSWTAESEYTVLTFETDQFSPEEICLTIADDDWVAANNGMYYFELLGLDYTGIIYQPIACDCTLIDIGIFNTACGIFEIRLRPGINFTSNITNLQFAIKWPANTVELINFTSNYELQQQGPVFVDEDYNYAVFVTVPTGIGLPISWIAGEEYIVLSFEHDQSGTGTIPLYIADDEWATLNNAVYYVELMGIDKSGSIYHEVSDADAGACNHVYLNVILQGAYDPANLAMRTSINAAGNLPNGHPYANEPWNYNGPEIVTSFPDSIVDWILVQLRDADDPTLLVEQRAGLLSKNGLVMEPNFIGGLRLTAAPGQYYLVVKHRNHMPVMSANPVTLPNDAETPYDFTEIIITQPYKHMDILATVMELKPDGSGKYGMIAGNVTPDDNLIYIGPNNDRDPILEVIRSFTGVNDIYLSVEGYYNQDVNLDNKVLYIGNNNDRDIIFANLFAITGSTLINIIYKSVVPPISNP